MRVIHIIREFKDFLSSQCISERRLTAKIVRKLDHPLYYTKLSKWPYLMVPYCSTVVIVDLYQNTMFVLAVAVRLILSKKQALLPAAGSSLDIELLPYP